MDETPHNIPFGHEETDASVDPILLTGAGLALLAAFSFALVFGIFRFLQAHPTPATAENPMASQQPRFPSEPRIEEHPAMDMQTFRAQEDSTLANYGWVDKKSGVVRIPIERAMELQLQRGFPTRQEAPKK